MSKKLPEETNCEACGSWEFECREDGEYYCIACALPVVKKVEEQANK